MKHKKKYITLASMIALGGVYTFSQFEDAKETKAATNTDFEVSFNASETADNEVAPTNMFGLYTDSGVIWDSSIVEQGGIKVYNYTIGDDFIGGLELSNELRPDFTYNMFYTLTKTDFEGKNKEVLVDNKQYTENQDIQTAGKEAGIYSFIIQMTNENDPDDVIIVNTIIYEQEALDFKLTVAEEDPKELTIATESDIKTLTYNISKYGDIVDETLEGGELINSITVEGTDVPDNLFKGLDKGSYFIEVVAESKPYDLTEGIKETLTNTETVDFEVTKDVALKPKVAVTQNSGVNPTDIIGTQTLDESEISWNIKDSEDKEIASEKTNQVYISELTDLAAGTYKATFTETATDGEKSTADTTFKIVKPAIELDVTETNPESVVAKASGVEGNLISWSIYETETETDIATGADLDVENTLLLGLEKGKYKITYTETDVYGNLGTNSADFTISEKGKAGDSEGLPIDGEFEEDISDEIPDNGEVPKEETPVEEETISEDTDEVEDTDIGEPSDGNNNEWNEEIPVEEPDTESPDDVEEEPDTENPDDGKEEPDTENPDDGKEEPDTENPDDGEEYPDTESPSDGNTNPSTESPSDGNTNPSTEIPAVDTDTDWEEEIPEPNEDTTAETGELPSDSDADVDKSDANETVLSEDRDELTTLEIKALQWGKQVQKTVTVDELKNTYGYANIKEADSELYLADWDGNNDAVAGDDSSIDADSKEYSDGTWRNDNVVKGENFKDNLEALVEEYTTSEDGKAYIATEDGKEDYKNYAESLQQTDKSSVMLSLGFLLTAVGLGFVLTYFLDKKKKKASAKTDVKSDVVIEPKVVNDLKKEDDTESKK